MLEALGERHGAKPIRQLERRHIRRMRDERADTPGQLNFAFDDELIPANPALRMRLFKTGEWRAWTDDECSAFEGRWPPGTMERRAYALALYTGQRKSDLVL